MTHRQIGSVTEHLDHIVVAMAISADHDTVTCEGKTITLQGLWDILPHLHSIIVSVLHELNVWITNYLPPTTDAS